VPVLEDGSFRLTESSAILKYLADKVRSPAYPTDLQKRARVNERMDWLNTGFYRDFSYGFLYPQIFPFMREPDDAVQAGRSPGQGEGARLAQGARRRPARPRSGISAATRSRSPTTLAR
jgi:glutathione S-transferase